MKSPDTYIDEVYEKYDETKKHNQKYKAVKMKPKRSAKSVCGVVTCLTMVLCIAVGKKANIKEIQHIEYDIQSESKVYNSNIYISYVTTDANVGQVNYDNLTVASEYVAIVSKSNHISTNYGYENGKFMLKTKSNLEICDDLRGNLKNAQAINCYQYGGEIPLEVIENDVNIDFKEWSIEYLECELSETEIENGIFKQVIEPSVEFEDGKQYLVFLSYDDEEECYKIFDATYGIMEYDPVTNKVKNIETGEFEDFDWSLIENS